MSTQIHDLGYRSYDGERSGVRWAVRSLAVHSMRRALGLKRAGKHKIVPVITIIGLQMGAVVAFAIITETVFNWPGLGRMFIQAVQDVDIPVMSAYLMLVALIIVAINLAVDILYVVVDPRIRSET